ncbi:MAG: short-chain dehydrogenase [Terriglobia bacterium]|nr:MAG: short-chain dehydrogenase [Terriglobia bacterium]
MAAGAALITGASSGIGAELAKLCFSAGYRVLLVARNRQALEELARPWGDRAQVLVSDLSETDAPQAIFDRLRDTPVEILINNAGFGVRGAFAETDWETEWKLGQVNMVALAHLTKLFLPQMLARRSGRILNVASTAAYVPGPFMAMYYASKAFVRSFSEALANETQGTGVTVTLLCPGPTRTGFVAAAGIEDSVLFRGPVMEASEVARIGFTAMMSGKTEVIAGRRNRWMMWSSRLAPRTMLAGITRRLNSPSG